MRSPQRLLLVGSLVIAASLAATFAVAQDSPKFDPPATSSAWLNSPPLTAKTLAGKGAFLWFFEEGCPRCRENWPKMFELAKKFEGKPVLFIAVSSGTTRPEIEEYAREVGLSWPILWDPERKFEKAAGVPEVSLQNIYQARVLKADGSIAAPGGDWEQVAEQALQGAKWNYDPADVPAALRAVWNAIETGDFPSAMKPLQQALKKADTKAAAEKLKAYVQSRVDEDAAELQKQVDAGEKWSAYKTTLTIVERYKGMKLPQSVDAARASLSKDEDVKKELVARNKLDAALKQMQTGQEAGIRKARAILDKLIAESPDTEAGQEAKRLLDAPSK